MKRALLGAILSTVTIGIGGQRIVGAIVFWDADVGGQGGGHFFSLGFFAVPYLRSSSQTL